MKVKFPLEIRAGSVRVKIYRTESRGYPLFQVADFSEGRRKLRGFANLAKAERIATRLATGEVVAARIGARERASFSRALELLKPTGVSLEVATSTFADSFQILGGNRLLEASRDFARRHPVNLPRKSVREAVDEMIEAKGRAGLARRSLDDLRSRLGQFAEAFDGPLAAATGDRIQTWLNGKGLSPQSTLNFRRVISNFTGFCVRRGYLPKGWDEADRIERPKVRPAETASRRIVPICDALAKWLSLCAERHGPVWTGEHEGFYDAQQATARVEGTARTVGATPHPRRTRLRPSHHPQRPLHRARHCPGRVRGVAAARVRARSGPGAGPGPRALHRPHAGRHARPLAGHRHRD